MHLVYLLPGYVGETSSEKRNTEERRGFQQSDLSFLSYANHPIPPADITPANVQRCFAHRSILARSLGPTLMRKKPMVLLIEVTKARYPKQQAWRGRVGAALTTHKPMGSASEDFATWQATTAT